MQITWVGSPNFTEGRPGPPLYIVDHWTVGSAHSTEDHFLDPNAKVSAHYMVKRDGLIDQFVDEADTAWHSGGQMYNYLGIGIEHEHVPGQDWPAEQMAASTELHAAISTRHGIPLIHRWDGESGVLGHRETGYATQCPGDLDIQALLTGDGMDQETKTYIDTWFKAISDKIDSLSNVALPIRLRRVYWHKDPSTGTTPVEQE